ncbi:MAG: serine/threonine protein kinase [Chitinispirillales bacterium]|jgi:serine/threonine-protein kinase|nr:serine/threonine protein kinase [Chitinispirillales bacterium]
MINLDSDKLIGREISGITLISLRGRSGKGLVFDGFQRSLGRKVAIKLIPKNSGVCASINSFINRAQVLTELDHPNIAAVSGAGEYEDFLFITMRLIEGVSLQSIIERKLCSKDVSKRFIPVAVALRIITAVLDALEYVHNEGIVHQDVKPGNILIEKTDKTPFLVDFGIARISSFEEKPKSVLGTPLYIAPEQARGEITDSRADIYCAGVTLWECLAGTLPAPSLPAIKLVSVKARNPENFFQVSPSDSSSKIDSELERIILKATASNRDMRYRNCGQFRNDINFYIENRY